MLDDPLELGWVAGLIEGEGWIGASGTTPGVKVAMTDEDVVARYAALIHTRYRTARRPTAGGKSVYVAAVYGDNARALLAAILPHLGARRSEQARLALLARSARPSEIHCRECGAPHAVATTGRTPVFCGAPCRNRARRNRRNHGTEDLPH